MDENENLENVEENERKEIEIVTGDGSELNISDVSEHINALRPKTNEKKNIVIPEVKESEENGEE